MTRKTTPKKSILFDVWVVDPEFGDWVANHVRYGSKDLSEITHFVFTQWATQWAQNMPTAPEKVLVNVKTGKIQSPRQDHAGPSPLQHAGRFQSQDGPNTARSPSELRQHLHHAIVAHLRSRKLIQQPWPGELTVVIRAGGPPHPFSGRRGAFPMHPWLVGFVLGRHKNVGYAYVVPVLDD